MATETQIVKEFVQLLRKHPDKFRHRSDLLRYAIHTALTRDDLAGRMGDGNSPRDRQYMAARLAHRVIKKKAQPFRRKKRGPLRRKASGKNEVTRRQILR